MKRKFYRSCVAVFLTMVMIFGGVLVAKQQRNGANAIACWRRPLIKERISF